MMRNKAVVEAGASQGALSGTVVAVQPRGRVGSEGVARRTGQCVGSSTGKATGVASSRSSPSVGSKRAAPTRSPSSKKRKLTEDATASNDSDDAPEDRSMLERFPYAELFTKRIVPDTALEFLSLNRDLGDFVAKYADSLNVFYALGVVVIRFTGVHGTANRWSGEMCRCGEGDYVRVTMMPDKMDHDQLPPPTMSMDSLVPYHDVMAAKADEWPVTDALLNEFFRPRSMQEHTRGRLPEEAITIRLPWSNGDVEIKHRENVIVSYMEQEQGDTKTVRVPILASVSEMLIRQPKPEPEKKIFSMRL